MMSGAYRHIGVASTFSPRFSAVLAEADRYARLLGGPMSVIHADKEHAEGIERFFSALEKLGRADDTGVLWSVGETPTEAILAACRRNEIDLLLAGALEREGEHRNFVGGVARDLLLRAPCDLLLIPKPAEQPANCRLVAVEVDLKNPCPKLLNRACEIASRLCADEMVFIGVVTPFDDARAAVGDAPLDEARLSAIVDEASGFEGEVDCRLLRSTTGFGVCEFLQDAGAQLFIAGLRTEGDARRLPTRLDWLQQVIPTDVLLISVEG